MCLDMQFLVCHDVQALFMGGRLPPSLGLVRAKSPEEAAGLPQPVKTQQLTQNWWLNDTC